MAASEVACGTQGEQNHQLVLETVVGEVGMGSFWRNSRSFKPCTRCTATPWKTLDGRELGLCADWSQKKS